ncbi:hypothetical protein D3C85_1552990 [compost metagenome]
MMGTAMMTGLPSIQALMSTPSWLNSRVSRAPSAPFSIRVNCSAREAAREGREQSPSVRAIRVLRIVVLWWARGPGLTFYQLSISHTFNPSLWCSSRGRDWRV